MKLSKSNKNKLIRHGKVRRDIMHGGKGKEIIHFPEVGGKIFPWYVAKDSQKLRSAIYSSEGRYVGFIDVAGNLLVYIRRGSGHAEIFTNRTFNINSRKSLLQAIRLAFLLTQKTK